MKKALLLSFLLLTYINQASAQCTPNATPCTNGAAVAPFGGLCDTIIADGLVGTPYLDNLQFYIQGICFDPTTLGVSVPIPGVTARISALNSITFSQLPNGITSGTNQASYTIPFNATVMGCGYFAGTPTQAGVFSCQVSISGSYTTANCYFFTTTGTEIIDYFIDFTVLPNASFSGLAASYCQSNAAVTLTPTGTTGGTFSGPGVSGNSFSPALAGPGTHTITYTVTAQQGTAIAPATNSSTQQVVVTSTSTFYADADNDGFGNPASSVTICSSTAPGGYVNNAGDCNDGVTAVNPNAPEICDGLDNNCNGNIDEGLTLFTYYADGDNDTYGNPAVSIDTCLSSAPVGFTANNTDCNDQASGINPGATDIPNNSIDEDCDGSDATNLVDNDNDSYDNSVDCNDNNANINPGATEVCDGVDNNCDGNIDEGLTQFTYYQDNDNDGYGNPANSISSCAANAPIGYSADNTDCNDNNMNVHPNATEICDGIDNDCDGNIDNGLTLNTYYLDADFDGFGTADSSITSCNANAPIGYANNSLDCNDGDININPNATEVCDGIDNDCDGNIDNGLTQFTYYYDGDNDVFGTADSSITTCLSTAPNFYVSNSLDCNDGNGNINPNAIEVCDGIDNDCDGLADNGLNINTYYLDADGDGFGALSGATLDTCSANPPNGYAATNDDCDDSDDSIFPGAIDVPNDGIDQDCDPTTSIHGANQTFNLNVYPNPTTGLLQVDLTQAKNYSLMLYDMKGELLQVEFNANGQGYALDMSKLALGVYLLKVVDEKGAYGLANVVKE